LLIWITLATCNLTITDWSGRPPGACRSMNASI